LIEEPNYPSQRMSCLKGMGKLVQIMCSVTLLS